MKIVYIVITLLIMSTFGINAWAYWGETLKVNSSIPFVYEVDIEVEETEETIPETEEAEYFEKSGSENADTLKRNESAEYSKELNRETNAGEASFENEKKSSDESIDKAENNAENINEEKNEEVEENKEEAADTGSEAL